MIRRCPSKCFFHSTIHTSISTYLFIRGRKIYHGCHNDESKRKILIGELPDLSGYKSTPLKSADDSSLFNNQSPLPINNVLSSKNQSTSSINNGLSIVPHISHDSHIHHPSTSLSPSSNSSIPLCFQSSNKVSNLDHSNSHNPDIHYSNCGHSICHRSDIHHKLDQTKNVVSLNFNMFGINSDNKGNDDSKKNNLQSEKNNQKTKIDIDKNIDMMFEKSRYSDDLESLRLFSQ